MMKLDALKVFKVSTPKNPGNWMGKVIETYINVGFYGALGNYIKNSAKDVANPNVSIGEMIGKTAIRVALFPVDVCTAPARMALDVIDKIVPDSKVDDEDADEIEIEIVEDTKE